MSEDNIEATEQLITHALTIQPLFVWEIQNSYKDAEYRSWALPEQHKNKWIALHSGKKLPTQQELAEVEKHVADFTGNKDFKLRATDLVRGAIVGFICFVDDAPDEASNNESDREWLIGSYYHRLETPIPCNGQLGFWRLSEDVLEQIDQSITTEVEFAWAKEEVE